MKMSTRILVELYSIYRKTNKQLICINRMFWGGHHICKCSSS